jgi:hypothetical protein
MNTLTTYVHKHLTQEKGRDISWIHTFSLSLSVCINSIDITKKQLRAWKHFLTASRNGSEEVRLGHSLNMLAKFGLVAVYAIFWYFASKFVFSEFHPLSFWDVNGSFWHSILWISMPVMLYAFLSGQLDWFGSSDSYEEGTIVAESIPFKWTVSIVAGITEELTHRSLMIFVGLISVYFTNMFFMWLVGFVISIIVLFILAKIEMPLTIALPVFIVTIITLIGIRKYLPDNPIYVLNEYIFLFLQWITSSTLRVGFFLCILMICAKLISIALVRQKVPDYEISSMEFIITIGLFTAFGAYCMPLGVQAIANMPIVPEGADHWTTILYISAVLWSNAKFRDGHKYQGLTGILSSYVFGIYMYYIAFTHGLLYAIVVHAMFDTILFSSEHMCQVWKNRHMI